MGVKTAASLDEYLRTSFPDLDPEYRDREIVERTWPDFLHSRTQTLLAFFGSEQEFDGAPILSCFPDFLKFNEFGIGHGHAFGLQQ